MLVLGLISVFQILFIPGAVVQLRWKNTGSSLFRLITMTGLSLIVNYLLAIVLVLFKIYSRSALIAILVAECSLLAVYRGKEIVNWLHQPAIQGILQQFESLVRFWRSLCHQLETQWSCGRIGKWIGIFIVSTIMMMAFVTVGLSLWSFYENSGTIFSNNDALVSWNRWALDWFHNRFPQNTYAFYPQLLTANWSISYVLVGESLQFLPKLIMPTFLVFMLLGLMDLALKRMSLGFLIAIPLVGHIFFAAIGRFWGIGEGLADILVSYMSFLPFYCLAYAVDEKEQESSLHFVSLGCVFAAGASVAKQSALFVLACYGLLAFLYAAKSYGIKSKSFRMCLVRMTLSIMVISAPFFVYRYVEIKRGIYPPISSDQYAKYNNRILGDSYSKRFSRAFNDIDKEILSPPLFANLPFHKTKPIVRSELIGISLLGFMFVLSIPLLRVVIILLGFGWLLIWSLFLSYDARNLSIAFPYLGVGIGIGLEAFIFKLRKFPLFFVLLMLMFIVAFYNFKYPASRLREMHLEKQKQIGNVGLNELLYKYKEREGITGKILTNYQILNYLPGFEPFYQVYYFESVTDPANDLQLFKRVSTPSNVGYLLVSEDSNPLIISELEKGIAQGNYELLFRVHQFIFVRNVGNGKLQNNEVIMDLMTGYRGPAVRIDGFGEIEGPYPQWSLPVVCWARGPVVSIEFDSPENVTDKSLILDWSCRLHVRPAGNVRVLMNGSSLNNVQFVGAQTWYDEQTKLPFQKGRNKIVLEFSKQQPDQSNLDGFCMLFKKLSLHWEESHKK
jgi:hypothetical protein